MTDCKPVRVCRKLNTDSNRVNMQRVPVLLHAWDEATVCPAGGVPWTSCCSVPLSFQLVRINSCQCWCWWCCETVDCNTHTEVSSDYIQCDAVVWCRIVMYAQEVLGSSLGPLAKHPTWGFLWCISVLQVHLWLYLQIDLLYHLIATVIKPFDAVWPEEYTKSCH
jgi:hypothetical protein